MKPKKPHFSTKSKPVTMPKSLLYYAVARLWTDAIIDPLETRTWIYKGIFEANHSSIEKKFNLGVLQV